MKDILYSYWLFIMKENFPKTIDLSDEDYMASNIYAYTDSYDVAENFRDIHDMRKLKLKKVRLTRQEVVDLSMALPDRFLRITEFSTFSGGEICDVKIASTSHERRQVHLASTDIMVTLSLKIKYVDPRLMSEKVRTALKHLGYVHMFEYQRGNLNGMPHDPFPELLSIDEVAVYIDLFGDILKGVIDG